MLQASVRSSSASSSKNESGDSNFVRQGSLRKVLPADPNKCPKLTYHNEEAQKIQKIFHQEYIILAEFQMLQTENLQGIYVIPSRENSLVWFGVIFVRNGLYKDGIFRFNIVLPDNFPSSEYPKIIFTSKIFHPVVDADTNELNLLGGFPEWKKGENHIWQILKYLNWIFYYFSSSIKHSVNKKASEMYKNNIEEFKKQIEECVQMSIERIYDVPATSDKHYLIFERYEQDVHDTVRDQMLNFRCNEKNLSIGHSWVAPGTFKPFSRISIPESSSSDS